MATNSTDAHNHRWRLVTLAIATLILVLVVLWRIDRSPRTDDAYAYADTINVVPEVNGRIIELRVQDNQLVKQGEILFRIDPRPYQATLAQATARLETLDKQIMLTQRTVRAQEYNAASVRSAVDRAKAVAEKANETLTRISPLQSSGYASAEEVDRARTAQRSAYAELNVALSQAQQASAAISGTDALEAQRAVVQAEIALAELNLEFTVVRAPFDGRIVSLKTTVGQFATALKPIFTLIDTQHWYVVANFRETELGNIRPGMPATLFLMTNSGRSFSGTVNSVGYGVLPNDGGLILEGLPRVDRSINWVHVSQRFPVKIRVDQPDPELFRLGASAIAIVHRTL